MGIVGKTVEVSCTDPNAPYDLFGYIMDLVDAIDKNKFDTVKALLDRPEGRWIIVTTVRTSSPLIEEPMCANMKYFLVGKLDKRAQIPLPSVDGDCEPSKTALLVD